MNTQFSAARHIHSVRAELVEAPREAFDKLRPFDRLTMHGPFDKLRANGCLGLRHN
jgi:hypothetical protein